MPAVDERLGFARIARFNYFPGWHQPFTAAHLVVDPKAWEALSPAQRAVVEIACTAGVTRNLAHGEAIQGAALKRFRERGVHVLSLPEDVLRELQRVTRQVLDEQAAANDAFRRVLESQRAFAAEYQDWKSVGYLPRDF
jgi:TRAP-type mannitol/chloroaromatic compound transport system substrate-binding protein